MSRFSGLSPAGTAVLLAMLAALMGYGLSVSGHARDGQSVVGSREPAIDDISLYRAIVARMRAGQPYEAAAVSEMRLEGYPLKPFVVVRPPALATALSWAPNEQSGDLCLSVLGLVTLVAAAGRLTSMRPSGGPLAVTVALLFSGIGAPVLGGLLSSFGEQAGMSLLHESWAGLLVALSLILRTDRRFGAAVSLGLLAALVRELAMPYLVVMALAAAMERRTAEALAFAAALAVAVVGLGLHAHAISTLVRAGDARSEGWMKFGGWPIVLGTTRWNLIAVGFGAWATAIIAPLAILGAFQRKDGFGARLAALLVGYAAGYMLVARPANAYWGFVTLPLSALGLAFAPAALIDLARRLRPQPGAPGAAPGTAP